MDFNDFLKQARELAVNSGSKHKDTIIFLIDLAEEDIADIANVRIVKDRNWYRAKNCLLNFFDIEYDPPYPPIKDSVKEWETPRNKTVVWLKNFNEKE